MIIKSCPTCESSLNVNSTGICPYCREVFDLENYDWILTDIK